MWIRCSGAKQLHAPNCRDRVRALASYPGTAGTVRSQRVEFMQRNIGPFGRPKGGISRAQRMTGIPNGRHRRAHAWVG